MPAPPEREFGPPTMGDRAEWLVAKTILSVVHRLPSSWLLAAANGGAHASALLAGRRRKLVERQVSETLGLDPRSPEVRRIALDSFRTLLINFVEPIVLERALRRGRPLQEFVTSVEGAEHLQRALASGRGVVIASGHLGSWESLLTVLHTWYRPCWVVARRLNNPLLDRLMLDWRQGRIKGRLAKRGCGKRMVGLLRSGDCVGMLLDQDAGRHGVRLDFLGVSASHHVTAGIMASRVRALVVPAYLVREPGSLRFRLVIEPAVDAADFEASPDAATEITRQLTASLERQVRAHPGQWLWLLDRWRQAKPRRKPTPAVDRVPRGRVGEPGIVPTGPSAG